MADGNPVRDNGPFENIDQAQAQFDAQMHGVPGETQGKTYLVLREATLISGVELSAFEEDQILWLSKSMTEVEAMVFAAAMVRAHLKGREQGELFARNEMVERQRQAEQTAVEAQGQIGKQRSAYESMMRETDTWDK